MVLQRENDGTIFVRKVMNGSPAALNGSIQINDRLLSINNTDVQGMVLDRVFDMINGPEGTSLTMSLSRNGSTYSVNLIRGQVRAPPAPVQVCHVHTSRTYP